MPPPVRPTRWDTAVVVRDPDCWFFVPWSGRINGGGGGGKGRPELKMGRYSVGNYQLAGLLVFVAAAFRFCRNSPVKIKVDTFGWLKIWEKGYSSSCDLCTTLVNAIASLAVGFGGEL
jgi:hypothetical protein